MAHAAPQDGDEPLDLPGPHEVDLQDDAPEAETLRSSGACEDAPQHRPSTAPAPLDRSASAPLCTAAQTWGRAGYLTPAQAVHLGEIRRRLPMADEEEARSPRREDERVHVLMR